MPDQIDATLDLLFEKFGLTVPVADFVYAEPHRVLAENAEYASALGVHGCAEARCHHLVFVQEAIDWQIWIEAGPRPVPRKLVIDYKTAPGSPQYEARLSGWDFNPRAAESAFEFHPPPTAGLIEFLETGEDDFSEDGPQFGIRQPSDADGGNAASAGEAQQ